METPVTRSENEPHRFARYARRCAILFGFIALTGCKREVDVSEGARDSVEIKAAPTITFKGYQFELTSSKNAEGSFFMNSKKGGEPLAVKAFLRGVRGGTTFRLGDKKTTAPDYGSTSVVVEVREKVLKVPLKDILGGVAVDLDLTFEVTIPGYRPVKEKVPPLIVRSAVGHALLKVIDGPVKFGVGDVGGDKPLRSIAIIRNTGSTLELVGSAALIADIDGLAIVEPEEAAAAHTCSGYKDAKTIEVIAVNSRVTLYDRRTAKKLEEKVFEPKTKCPKFAFVKDKQAKHYVNQAALERYYRTKLSLP